MCVWGVCVWVCLFRLYVGWGVARLMVHTYTPNVPSCRPNPTTQPHNSPQKTTHTTHPKQVVEPLSPHSNAIFTNFPTEPTIRLRKPPLPTPKSLGLVASPIPPVPPALAQAGGGGGGGLQRSQQQGQGLVLGVGKKQNSVSAA